MPIEVDDFRGTARFIVREGETLRFALEHKTTSQEPPRIWPADEIGERLADTAFAWHTWSELHQAYEGPWRDLVHHSGRVLYALTYYPTGAICAAPTTSLPETPGGSRNWDYRYAWVRDASFTIQALWVAACPDEADKFFDFMSGAAASLVRRGADLQIMFGIGGERDLTERELPHLTGWRDSAPVRVGNGAWNQRQLDVYGELLDAAYRLPDQLDRLAPSTRQFLADLADTAAALARAGPGHLGSARRAARLPLLQAHVLGRARPCHQARRPLRRDRSRRRLDAHATRSRTRSSPAAGTRRPAHSRSPSAPKTSTRRT